MCVLTAPLTDYFSISLVLGLPVLWDTTVSKLGQCKPILQWPLSVHPREELCVFHFKSKSINDKAWWERHAWKPRQDESEASCDKQASCECKEQVLEGKLEVLLSEQTNGKKAKQPYHWCGETFSGLDRRSNQPWSNHSRKLKFNPEQDSNSLSSIKVERWRSYRGKVWSQQSWFMRSKEERCLYNVKVQGESTKCSCGSCCRLSGRLS